MSSPPTNSSTPSTPSSSVMNALSTYTNFSHDGTSTVHPRQISQEEAAALYQDRIALYTDSIDDRIFWVLLQATTVNMSQSSPRGDNAKL